MAPKTKSSSSLQLLPYDWGMASIVATLITLGLIMVFSASYARGLDGFGDPYYFISRQIIWTLIGVVAMVVASRIDYLYWERFSIPLMALALIALMGVIAFGADTFGSTRTYFSGSVQPSEPAKIIIIIYISTWLASKGQRIREIKVGLAPFSILMGAVTVLIVTQPDISTAILVVVTASVMFFIAGAKLNQLLVVGLIVGSTFAAIIRYSDYASARVERYWDALSNPLQSSEYQTSLSVWAIIRGEWFGVGLGNSRAKLTGFLPVSWSDNIFAIVGEELGLLGAFLVILLFAMFAYRGLKIAINAPDNFGMLLATGITSLLILQAILNTAVVAAVAPATGVTLPFISYGGSSLVTAMGAVGILLSISRYSSRPVTDYGSTGNLAYARFNFGWRDGGARLPRARSRSQARRSQRPAVRRSSAASGRKSSSAPKRRTVRESR